MRITSRFVFAILALALLLPALVAAQPQPASIREELERTDRILERAREQVGISVSSQAGSILRRATEIQAKAWAAFYERRYPAAMQFTRKARDFARQALETAEITVKAHESIRDLVESTKDLLDEAGPVVRQSRDREAARLMDVGSGQLQRAVAAYRDRQYRKAISLVSAARDLVQRALDRARADSSGGVEAISRALERTQALIDEVQLACKENPDDKAQALLEQALQVQGRARDQLKAGHPELALRLTARAREAGLEALLLLSKAPTADEVERALAVVEQLITDLSPEVAASGSGEARAFLESARQRHAEASQKLANGDAGAAMATARVAQGLLRRAADAAGIQ